MELVINGYALNLSAEQAVAPRVSLVGRILRTIVPAHVLASTSVSLD